MADDHVSRRDFFRTVGVGSVATAVVGGVKEGAAQGPAALGPGEVAVTLTVNGRRHQLKVEPRVTLLDALRTRLEITGPKRVCDRGACGACTVIIEGRTYYACSMLAIDAQGRNVRTVEGLAEGDALHPVQQAFCDHDALMCGFCTPGFSCPRWRCSRRRLRRRPSRRSARSTGTSAAAGPTWGC
jgi:xanthine dehydrogenase YagT iron-sulfur-binding subunit